MTLAKLSLLFVSLVVRIDSLNICGLGYLNKCRITDAACIKYGVMETLKWFQTPHAEGYFIKPVSPYHLDQLIFDFPNHRIILKDVTLEGLNDIDIDVLNIREIARSKYRITYMAVINVILQAHLCMTIDLIEGTRSTEKITDIRLDKLKVFVIGDMGFVPRCNESIHMHVALKDHVLGGQAKIIRGLNGLECNGDCEKHIVDVVAHESIKIIYEALNQLYHSVGVEELLELDTN